MSGTVLNLDLNFPRFTEDQEADEKCDTIVNYLYMLLEQFRYSLNNLGTDNFNDTELEELGKTITEPIEIRLESDEGDISDLQVTATGLRSDLTSAEGNITSLQQTTTGLTTRMTSAEGNISTLTQTATTLSGRIDDVEGDYASLSATVSGLSSTVSSHDGSISTLTQTASTLSGRIDDVEGDYTSLSATVSGLSSTVSSHDGSISTLSQTVGGLSSTVSSHDGSISTLTQTASDLSTRIGNAEGDITTLQAWAGGISFTVSNSGTSSTFTMTSGTYSVTSPAIQFSGYVTFGNLTDGTTTISGSNITTGTINASNVAVTNINASNISSGTLSASRISGGSIDASNVTITNLNASNISSGTLSASYIKLGGQMTVYKSLSSTNVGGYIGYYNAGDTTGITLQGSGSNASRFVCSSTNLFGTTPNGYISFSASGNFNVSAGNYVDIDSTSGSRLKSSLGAVYIAAYTNTYPSALTISYDSSTYGKYASFGSNVIPSGNGSFKLGWSSLRWKEIWCTQSSINSTSDREKKKDISYDMDVYDGFFDRLRPTPFRYKDGESGRIHLGMIAQDVEEALASSDLTALEFAGFLKDQKSIVTTDSEGCIHAEPGEGYDYGLRYNEFIALCIDQIQRLKTRVTVLERSLNGNS